MQWFITDAGDCFLARARAEGDRGGMTPEKPQP